MLACLTRVIFSTKQEQRACSITRIATGALRLGIVAAEITARIAGVQTDLLLNPVTKGTHTNVETGIGGIPTANAPRHDANLGAALFDNGAA